MDWEELETFPSDTAPNLSDLLLVRQLQAREEPLHWSLFICKENTPGSVSQVCGDSVAMVHHHATNISILSSDSYHDSFIIAKINDEQAQRVRHWATVEPPPKAADAASVYENCQGWVIRVIQRLVGEEIVQSSWLEEARRLQELVI